MAYFWNTILTINSVLMVLASTYLVYAFGMMFIALEWQRFVVALITWVILFAIELAISTILHN